MGFSNVIHSPVEPTRRGIVWVREHNRIYLGQTYRVRRTHVKKHCVNFGRFAKPVMFLIRRVSFVRQNLNKTPLVEDWPKIRKFEHHKSSFLSTLPE